MVTHRDAFPRCTAIGTMQDGRKFTDRPNLLIGDVLDGIESVRCGSGFERCPRFTAIGGLQNDTELCCAESVVGVNEMNAPNRFGHTVGVRYIALLGCPCLSGVGCMDQCTVTADRPTHLIVEHIEPVKAGSNAALLGYPRHASIYGINHSTGIANRPTRLWIGELNAPDRVIRPSLLSRPCHTAICGVDDKSSIAARPAVSVINEKDG